MKCQSRRVVIQRAKAGLQALKNLFNGIMNIDRTVVPSLGDQDYSVGLMIASVIRAR